MDIHVEKIIISSAGGTGSQNTLPIIGGLLRHVYVLAGTSTTSFRFDIADSDAVYLRSYDFHNQEINDDETSLPVRGILTARVTNASADGQFTVRLSFEQ